MKFKFYDILTPKTYKTGKKDKNEKNKWLKVGTLRVTEDGKMFIEWNVAPDVTYMVVEQNKKPTSNGENT